MTTCTYFDATLKGVYADYIKAKRDPSVIRNNISLESGPYVVPKDTPIANEFVDKLPTQSRSDCGAFVIKYADLFIRGKINEILPNMDDMIANYRDDLAVTLYIYAQKKINEGYSTEDMTKGKKSKKKNLDSC
uniref:Ubiquitin-like protease family profile domain-containing protein n=1 Tax=Cannabis sativa TaxID=3483 RepID=A0A803NUD6_CANSA